MLLIIALMRSFALAQEAALFPGQIKRYAECAGDGAATGGGGRPVHEWLGVAVHVVTIEFEAAGRHAGVDQRRNAGDAILAAAEGDDDGVVTAEVGRGCGAHVMPPLPRCASATRGRRA